MTGNVSTYEGWVDNNWDTSDYYPYSCPTTGPPPLSWTNTSADLDLTCTTRTRPHRLTRTTTIPSLYRPTHLISVEQQFTTMLRLQRERRLLQPTIGLANLSSSPAYNQNDANSGETQGMTCPPHSPLLTRMGHTTAGIDTSDNYDFYSVQVPSSVAIEESFWNVPQTTSI